MWQKARAAKGRYLRTIAPLNCAKLGQEMARIEAVAPLADGAAVLASGPVIDRPGHSAFDDLGQGRRQSER